MDVLEHSVREESRMIMSLVYMSDASWIRKSYVSYPRCRRDGLRFPATLNKLAIIESET